MKELMKEVRASLLAAQQARKEQLDRDRVETVFNSGRVGDQVLLRTKELLDAAEIGKLRPRWEGPFGVTLPSRPSQVMLPRCSTPPLTTFAGRGSCLHLRTLSLQAHYHQRSTGPAQRAVKRRLLQVTRMLLVRASRPF
jgi:hypothetical protein